MGVVSGETMQENAGTLGEEDTPASDDPRVANLSEIFTEVTGVEGFVETQEQSETSKRLMADNDPGDYVATMVRTTGLSETLGEPKADDAGE